MACGGDGLAFCFAMFVVFLDMFIVRLCLCCGDCSCCARSHAVCGISCILMSIFEGHCLLYFCI
jgi:hypothetical protein